MAYTLFPPPWDLENPAWQNLKDLQEELEKEETHAQRLQNTLLPWFQNTSRAFLTEWQSLITKQKKLLTLKQIDFLTQMASAPLPLDSLFNEHQEENGYKQTLIDALERVETQAIQSGLSEEECYPFYCVQSQIRKRWNIDTNKPESSIESILHEIGEKLKPILKAFPKEIVSLNGEISLLRKRFASLTHENKSLEQQINDADIGASINQQRTTFLLEQVTQLQQEKAEIIKKNTKLLNSLENSSTNNEKMVAKIKIQEEKIKELQWSVEQLILKLNEEISNNQFTKTQPEDKIMKVNKTRTFEHGTSTGNHYPMWDKRDNISAKDKDLRELPTPNIKVS